MYCSICTVHNTMDLLYVISPECNLTESGLLPKGTRRWLVRNLRGVLNCHKDGLCHTAHHACRWSCWSFFPFCADINVSISSLDESSQIKTPRFPEPDSQKVLEGQKLTKRLNVPKYRESTHTRHCNSEILSSCLDCIEINSVQISTSVR